MSASTEAKDTEEAAELIGGLSLCDNGDTTASMCSVLAKRDLYGGAMTIAIPHQWRDVSQVRQVPDHQEVYQDCTFSNDSRSAGAAADTNSSDGEIDIVGTGACIVVEILQREEDVSDDDAAIHFFTDLAEVNGGMIDSGQQYSRVWVAGHDEEESKIEPGDDEKQQGRGDGGVGVGGNNLMPKLSTRVKACTCVGFQSIEPLKNRTELEEGKASKVKIELCVLRLEKVETDLLITLTMPWVNDEIGDSKKIKVEGHSSLFLDILRTLEVVDWSLFI